MRNQEFPEKEKRSDEGQDTKELELSLFEMKKHKVLTVK